MLSKHPPPWCKEVLLYSPGSPHDSPETRVELFAAVPIDCDQPDADHPTEFAEGQWWLAELDAMAAASTPNQKRAVAVVRHLLRSAHQHCLPR